MNRGVPAIQPRNTSVPSFTEQDVRDHFSRGVFLGQIMMLGQPTIAQVVFATIHDLDYACGERYFEANYPADLPICYVELSGTFGVSRPPGLHASGVVSSTRSSAYMVFDARTGNALVMDTPSRARWD